MALALSHRYRRVHDRDGVCPVRGIGQTFRKSQGKKVNIPNLCEAPGNQQGRRRGLPIERLQLLGLRRSLWKETCRDFLAIDPRTPLPALIGHEGRIRLMGHLQRLEHGGQETNHLRNPGNGVIFLLADGWAIKLIYTHSLFQP